MNKKYLDIINERIGETNKNRYGSIMVIEEYKNCDNIRVKFVESDNLVKTQYIHFKKGSVNNPYDKSIYNVGFIGEGGYRVWTNGKNTAQYQTWHSMLRRCYSEKEHKRFPTYKDCSVDESWHNFQNFAAWYDENFYQIEKQRMNIDKDILHKGNKVYSPDTCIFVPQNINKLFVKRDIDRGYLPIGVQWDKVNKNYRAICSYKGENINLGRYSTPEEAFQSYKEYKETLIKNTANEYKDKLPNILYEAMINYKVEITD